MKSLNTENMKKIVHEIADKELKGNSEKVYPVTYNEYFNELEDSVKLKISDTIIRNVDGYNHKGNIVVFLDKISEKKSTIAWKIFCLVENTYHEVRHTIQKKFDSYNYDGFLGNIDNVLSILKTDTYYSDYNSFSYELGANLYGVQKAKEYMQTKFPNHYKKISKKIELKEEKYKYDYMMYDASHNVNRLIIELQHVPNIKSKKSVKEISSVLDIFMNSNFTFKRLTEIKSDPRFKSLDKRIIYAILSSPSFYNDIAIEELSKEELELLYKSLNYTHRTYQNQSAYLEYALNKKIINNRTYYYNQRSILNKLKPVAEKENLIKLYQEQNKGRTY